MPVTSLVDARGRPRKGNRRPHGAGTIHERRPGYFVVRIRIGSSAPGQRAVQRAGRGTRADAERWLDDLAAAHGRTRPEPQMVVPTMPDQAAARRRQVQAVDRPRRAPRFVAKVHRGRFDVEALIAGQPVTLVARQLGVDPSTLYYRMATGGLDAALADEWAIRLGRHPLEVWGERWLDLANTGDDEP